jgi:uncharacterized protein (DUF1800 family)
MNQQIKVQHLFWRAGFGMTSEDFLSFKNQSIAHIVEHLFAQAKKYREVKVVEGNAPNFRDLVMADKDERKEMAKDFRKLSRQYLRALNIRWIKELVESPAQLVERMAFFWHGHFACQPKNIYHAQNQLNTFRKYGLGKFGDLLLAVAKDPAMLQFLNNQQNRKAKPNENFARELMELFTLGRGHYSEKDIKESARAFTGWGFDGEEYIFRQTQHDFGQKTFMGKTGDFNGEDIIQIILQNPQTAQFITAKIYKHFVNEVPDNQIIEDLSRRFYQSGYDIEKLMREIFTADWFYSEKNIGAKIKSPIELIVGLQRQLNMRFSEENSLLFIQKVLGQMLLNPPNVAGWAGGKNWIDSSSLIFRLKLAENAFRLSAIEVSGKEEEDAQKTDIFTEKLQKFEAVFDWRGLEKLTNNNQDKNLIYSKLADFLLQVKSDKIKKLILEAEKNISSNLIQNFAISLCSVPEYQVC